MDSAEKLLGVLRGLPLWMLAALCIVAVTASFYAPLQAGLPTTLHAQLPLLAVLLGTMTLCAALTDGVMTPITVSFEGVRTMVPSSPRSSSVGAFR